MKIKEKVKSTLLENSLIYNGNNDSYLSKLLDDSDHLNDEIINYEDLDCVGLSNIRIENNPGSNVNTTVQILYLGKFDSWAVFTEIDYRYYTETSAAYLDDPETIEVVTGEGVESKGPYKVPIAGLKRIADRYGYESNPMDLLLMSPNKIDKKIKKNGNN